MLELIIYFVVGATVCTVSTLVSQATNLFHFSVTSYLIGVLTGCVLACIGTIVAIANNYKR